MRLVFLGNDPWSVPALEALLADPRFEVVEVLTNPPRPAGRGAVLTPTAVADAARRAGVVPREVAGVRSGPGFDVIQEAAPDILIVVAYGELLSAEVVSLARFGAVNLHLSLLPRWRGASPVHHAILYGDQRTGVSIMQIDMGLDTGPVLARAEDAIRRDDDAGSLGARLAVLGAALLLTTLPASVNGTLRPEPQPSLGATYAPKLTAADRVIPWGDAVSAIDARVRAFSPEPGANTTFRGSSMKVLGIEPIGAADGSAPAEPGTVVAVDDQGARIAVGDGSVRLSVVSPAGRKRMSGADWARGARVQVGESFG